jgi:peptidoglycan L-alanyl-D-glutamate endopeptidase CwlK
MELNQRSKNNLKGVNNVLIEIVEKSVEIFNTKYNEESYFVVTEGVRTLERQKQLLAEKKSQTLDSYHITGHAIDVALFLNGKITWNLKDYKKLADIIKQAAKDLGYDIVWGGDWKKFKDGVHFQIDRSKYK